MYLSQIWIYPVKSMSGISVYEAEVRERGLNGDRFAMVVDETGKFITQREFPELALIGTQLIASGLRLYDRKGRWDELIIAIDSESPILSVDVKIWNDQVMARTVGQEADDWLSRCLGKSVRLVIMNDTSPRILKLADQGHHIEVSFADEFPYLLTSMASLESLNRKLAAPVDMRHFRPNLVIAGSSAFEEDSWKMIQIGTIRFKICKPCERCMVVNVDPDEGVRKREPLKTLASFRKRSGGILFGQDLVALESGVIRVGEEVVLL